MITNILLWWLPWTVWTRMTPNCNILCGTCGNSVHWIPCAACGPILPCDLQITGPCSAPKGAMGQLMLRSLLQDFSYLLYFPSHDTLLLGGGTQYLYTIFSEQTPLYHFSLPETPATYSSHPPRRTWATLRSSTSSSFCELPLGFLQKPHSSGWFKETFCCDAGKIQTNLLYCAWWGCY